MGCRVPATCVPAMYVLQWFMLKKEMGVRFRSQKGRPGVFREVFRVIRGRRGPSERGGPSEGEEDHQRERRTIRGRGGPPEGEEDHQREEDHLRGRRTIREKRTIRGRGRPSEGEEDHQREKRTIRGR